jgi:hypothetical protein
MLGGVVIYLIVTYFAGEIMESVSFKVIPVPIFSFLSNNEEFTCLKSIFGSYPNEVNPG